MGLLVTLNGKLSTFSCNQKHCTSASLSSVGAMRSGASGSARTYVHEDALHVSKSQQLEGTVPMKQRDLQSSRPSRSQ